MGWSDDRYGGEFMNQYASEYKNKLKSTGQEGLSNM